MQENTENREENHMEKHNGISRQGKNKYGELGMSTRGGGIEKAIALGGALAVAGLIAAFSITKSSNKDTDKHKTNVSAQDTDNHKTNVSAQDTDKHKTNVSAQDTDNHKTNVSAQDTDNHKTNVSAQDTDNHKTNVSAQDTESCANEEDAHQNLCCTAMTETEASELVSTQSLITLDSVSDQQETLVHDAKQERNGNLENESNVIANLEMETFEITIVDKAMDVVAKQPALQSSVSREDDDEEEEFSPMRSSFSIEDDRTGEEEESTENGGNVWEVDEESSEGTWSSSPEPTNMEVIWPAEMMDMNVSKLESEMKYKEEDIKGKIETYPYASKTTFDRKKKKKVVMDVRKEQHSAKRQTWVWFGLVLLMLAVLANILLQSNNVSFVFPHEIRISTHSKAATNNYFIN